MCKKALCLIFAFLLSIESFAAVVSDNDGSAFITKAEFDSLKNDFQSQLDAYNTSIDSKIDNAIASYLSGINIEAETTLLNNYNSMTLDGNKDRGVRWSSNNNLILCSYSTQKLAMDYFWISGDAFNGKGYATRWSKIVDSENKGRQRKRYWIDENGYVKGRYIWKFWVNGGYTGSVYKTSDEPTINGHTWSSDKALILINNRKQMVYTAIRGNGYATNMHYGSAVYLYHEEQNATNENVGIYPLSETNGEYTADDRKQTPTVTYSGTTTILTSDSEFGFNSSNGQQIGEYPKAGANNFGDSIDVTLSGLFTSYKLSDLKYLNFYQQNKKNDRVKCGIAIATATSDSEITVSGKCSDNGYVILYNKQNADTLWNGQRSSVTDITSWKITDNYVEANKDWKRKLENVNKGDGIFILYLPLDTSVLGTMNINEIKQKKKQ